MIDKFRNRILLLVCCILPMTLNAQDRTALNNYLQQYESFPLEEKSKRISSIIDISWEYLYINTDTALIFAELAVEIGNSNSEKLQLPLANAFGMLGTVKDVQGNKQGALRDYLEALDICTSITDSNCIGRMNNNIGALFYSQHEYEKSYPYFMKALHIESTNNDTSGQIGSLINLGIIKKNLQDMSRSKQFLLKALKLNNSFSDPYYLGTIYGNLGSHAFALNELDTALFYYKMANEYHLAQNQLQNYGISTQNMASIYLKKGMLLKAMKNAQEAKSIAIKGNFFFLRTETYETLYETFLALNQMDSAFYYKGLYEAYNDSILLKENKEIVNELEAQYKTAQKEKELLTEKMKLSNEKKSSQFLRSLIVSAALLLILLVIFIFFKNKSNRILATKNQIIESSLEEKEVLMREIHHRVKNNIQAIKSIINIQKRKTKSNEVKEHLNITLNRVNAMSLIHSKLYQQKQVIELDSKIYFTELIVEVLNSFGLIEGKNLKSDFKLKSYVFETDTLLTLGLVVNELITNACKYGKSENGTLLLQVTSIIIGQHYVFTVQDSGPNAELPENSTFGNELVKALLHKLAGTIDYQIIPGYIVTIKIPIKE